MRKAIFITLILLAGLAIAIHVNRQMTLRQVLFSGARSGNLEMVAGALKEGIKIDSMDGVGQTALHMAAYAGECDVVKMLIKHKANVSARDKQEGTPLHWAAIAGKHVCAELLLRAKADPNAVDVFGKTPLHWVAGAVKISSNEKIPVVRVLLKYYADPYLKDKRKKLAVDYALNDRNRELTALLTAISYKKRL